MSKEQLLAEASVTLDWLRKGRDGRTSERRNAKLINEPMLAAQFTAGSIRCVPSTIDTPQAIVETTMLAASLDKIIATAKKVLAAHPDYIVDPNNYRLTFVYERLYIDVLGINVDRMLNDPDLLEYFINSIWLSLYFVDLGPYMEMIPFNAVIRSRQPEIKPSWAFVPKVADTDLQDLINAVHSRQYILMHQGVGLSAPGKETLLYTNGSGAYVDHPDFGRLPAGLTYLDLRTWNGETRDFTKADVRKLDADAM
ncbi:hypothetical protein AB870_13700 [Pandoraea faecigallinarum]|uniref:Uncharacterized protein n=1 Tax=Pandoraea faecigallinarum TaxID=656179 RepID=A0A0H3WRW3_9BURK|nr:hypothetical protein [Pandoraea faecigallinarum]AKM30939.1 hypothetical protein AB870_13700 [Pandoraea faecigallinarum]